MIKCSSNRKVTTKSGLMYVHKILKEKKDDLIKLIF